MIDENHSSYLNLCLLPIQSYLREHEAFRNSIAGAAAGTSTSFLTCPLDVVKTRLQQSYPPRYNGTMDGLITIFRTEGYRGWYRGLSVTILGYLPSWGIYFTVYEKTKQFLYQLSTFPPPTSHSSSSSSSSISIPISHHHHDHHLYHYQHHSILSSPISSYLTPNVINILSAMSAGIVSTTLTNPLWVVKSRFMTQSSYTSYHYHSISDAFKQMFTNEGILGFYKGLATSLLGVSHTVVQFPLYERFKFMFHYGTFLYTHRDHPPDLHHCQAIATHHILAASVLSKMIASMITYPHEVIRTRLQNQTYPIKYNSLRHCIRLIIHEEGYRAFYRGLSTNLIRTLPASAITLFTYERLARWLHIFSNVSLNDI